AKEPPGGALTEEQIDEAFRRMSVESSYMDPGVLTDLLERSHDLYSRTGVTVCTGCLLHDDSVRQQLQPGQIMELSKALIRARPRQYIEFVVASLWLGVIGLVLNSYAANTVALLV